MNSRSRLQEVLPKLVLAPSFVVILIFVYGFIAYTGYLSMTDSKMLPSYNFAGLTNYSKLWALPHWWRAITNLAIFASLYIIICSVLGLFLAILLDQKIRAEGLLRPIYLYPMALSFIVTGTAWKWFLDPGIGLENTMHIWGWTSFSFNWIKDGKFAIYCVVIAAVWQSSGFVMAMFLAGLRGVDNEIIKAAQIDGCTRWQAFWQVEFPLAGPGIASSGIFAFLTSWNEFALASQLTRSINSKTLPVGLLDYTAEFTIDWRGMCALAVVMIVPALVLTFIVQKHLVGGLTSGAVKG